MIVFGGTNGAALVGSAESFDPSTNSWAGTTTSSPPAARSGHTAVWTGSRMVVWGGYDGANYLYDGKMYDPSIDTWYDVSQANAPAGRSDHTAVWTGTVMIVWGGYDGFSTRNDGGIFNPSSNSWTAVTSGGAPSGRYYHTAAWTGSSCGRHLDHLLRQLPARAQVLVRIGVDRFRAVRLGRVHGRLLFVGRGKVQAVNLRNLRN